MHTCCVVTARLSFVPANPNERDCKKYGKFNNDGRNVNPVTQNIRENDAKKQYQEYT
jgi:hypothetical protein